MVVDHRAGDRSFHVEADEDVDRPVVAMLLRDHVSGPEDNADRRRARCGFRVDAVRLEVERFAAERREGDRRRKHLLVLGVGFRIGVNALSKREARRQRDHRHDQYCRMSQQRSM